jgi:hypothetical protein
METVSDEFIDEDLAVEILLRALRANPKARWRAIAKLRQLIAELCSHIESPRIHLPEPKPITPRFETFYAAMATFWECAL